MYSQNTHRVEKSINMYQTMQLEMYLQQEEDIPLRNNATRNGE